MSLLYRVDSYSLFVDVQGIWSASLCGLFALLRFQLIITCRHMYYASEVLLVWMGGERFSCVVRGEMNTSTDARKDVTSKGVSPSADGTGVSVLYRTHWT